MVALVAMFGMCFVGGVCMSDVVTINEGCFFECLQCGFPSKLVI